MEIAGAVRRVTRFAVRHPASLILGVGFCCAAFLWVRAGRHYDSVEFLTPKCIVTVQSEMRVLVVVGTVHDDSSWEMFYNTDIATVPAPWAVATLPKVWVVDGEAGLFIVQAHLAIALLLFAIGAFWLEKYLLRCRTERRRGG